MSKRTLLMVVALIASLAIAATGTLAYLTDTDSDVNVMTLGNVEIDQIELERNDGVADDAPLAEGDLSSFQQGQALYPAYAVGDNAYEPQSSIVWGEYVTADNAAVSNLWDDKLLTGALDKFVFVENTGKSPAYVRTVFAFEAPEGVEDKLHFNLNEVEGLEWEELGYIDVQGVNCKLVSAVYSEALAAGEISIPSLLQVALNHNATNEDVAKLGDLYSIYVVSQAVQVANMENLTAAEALDAAFGELSEESHPWMDGQDGDQAPNMRTITVNDAAELQAALDAAQDGDIIILNTDITGDVTVPMQPDVTVTIEGAGKEFAGVITVDGKSGTYLTSGLNIQNVNFKAESISQDACIRLGGTTPMRYTCNVSVTNCTFDVPGAVGVKSYTGGDKNVTISGCTATEACHSLVQLKGVDGVLIQDCTVRSKNGLNFNNSDNVTIEDCTVSTKGYAVRFGESSGGSGAAETYLIKDCSLQSANEDGDATIILRGTADNSTLTIENTTLTGNPDVQNNATGATVVR